MSNQLVWPMLLLSSLVACGGAKTNETQPPRSPTTDYPHPASRTADGQVVGADGVPPEDRLRAGPKVGSGGVTPAERPGGPETPETCSKDGVTPTGKPCKPAAPKPTPK